METHHVSNPWQQQRQYKQDMFIPDPPDTFPLTDAETRSYDDFFEDRKKIFYQSKLLLQRLQLQEQQQQQEEKLLNYNEHLESRTEGEEDEETGSQSTAWSRLGTDSPSNQSSSTLADSTTVLYMSDSEFCPEGDVLESLVHTLQSEVQDSQATVHELEDRLNLAEHSNRHIIEELKMLLADAENTLRNNGKVNSSLVSGGKGFSSYEDSNIVYNRICIALQSLIDEAQLALQKNSTKQPIPEDIQPIPSVTTTIPTSPPKSDFLPEQLPKISEADYTLNHRIPEKNSSTLLDSGIIYDKSQNYDLSSYSPITFYSAKDEVARIYWKQKHEEQHDRYRRSSQRLTLELDGRFQGLSTDSDDSEASFNLPRHIITRDMSVRLSPYSTSSTPSIPSTPTTPTTPTLPLQGILRSSKKDGSKKDRLKKKYQVQFLNADVEGTSRKNTGLSTTSHRYEQQKPRQQGRQYTSRSVGSKPSRSVLLQLYELWQQTWLRTRIMHVITGSVEIVIIIWVVIKASRITLTWFGVQPSSINQWITFIYGHRDSAGASAKELYAKIRKDGLQMRQIKAWTRKEPVELVEDLVAGAASTSLISPSSIVYGPAKRVMAHAATGVALAFLSDGARRLVRKL